MYYPAVSLSTKLSMLSTGLFQESIIACFLNRTNIHIIQYNLRAKKKKLYLRNYECYCPRQMSLQYDNYKKWQTNKNHRCCMSNDINVLTSWYVTYNTSHYRLFIDVLTIDRSVHAYIVTKMRTNKKPYIL